MLDELPDDILIAIADHLTSACDRCNLSATCQRLRSALAPSVFRSVRATNGGQDAAAIWALAVAHGHHFRHMRFQCMLHGNPLAGHDTATIAVPAAEEGLDDLDGTAVSTFATDIISGRLAPRIDALTLEFIADHNFAPRGCRWVDDVFGIGGSIYISFWRECAEDVVASEEKFEWRRLMADVWRAVASNPTVRSLTILSLPPVLTTAWLKPQWVHFVGQLEHLSIQMWGADNGEGLHSRTTPGYQDFFEHLTTLFFDPADGLLSLEFVASPFGTYGGDNQFFETPFTIGLSSMPRLRQLRLQNCFFDKRLLSFMQRRADTLEKIHLIEFMAAVFVSGNHRNLTWADLFDGISSAEPRKLTADGLDRGGMS
ncbi:hypothetical protein DFJ73DRAFT_491739 [Zopfochytrium polystomum]|nr:hypothetical protein DFJ73DRAFT_491739 [Zopfochytrium polystomum]